ncbi:P-loop containing nucleoside triphosphate hydrolase protein [Rhexocercosporidium sp. MPI-PUGE-AT-0058]|nr:P-loop containing nucleoside triphosphate hydrolase protein [Rhexocercosporidium sp. MPI-PUGE-AT-0058]
MAPEPPNHLVIGTDSTHLVEYDKVASSPDRKIPLATSTVPQNASASPVKTQGSNDGIGSKHIYRIEYTDNTGTVIAVKKGSTPPAHNSNQGDDAPVFELIKRVRVFAKGSKKDDAEKPKDGTASSARKDDKPMVDKKEEIDSKHGEAVSSAIAKDLTDATKDIGPEKATDTEDLKLKDFDISPESNTTWSLKILSEYLMNALRAVVEYYPGLQLLSHDVEFNEPYKELIHHMDQLDRYKDNQPDDHTAEYQNTCKEHIDELLKYLKDTFSEKLNEEYMRHKRDIPVCTFPYLWLLFKPGEEVYWTWGNSAALSSMFIVEKVSEGVLGGTRATGLKVENWRVDYNCEVVGRAGYSEILQPFDGEKPIHELKMYPTRFYKEDPKRKSLISRQEQLLQNGKTFFRFCKSNGHYMMLRGRPVAGKGQKPMVHGRVVIDMDQYYADPSIRDVDLKPVLMANDNDINDDNEDDTTARTGCRCVNCGKKPRQRKGRDWTKFDNIDPDDSPAPDDDLFYRLCNEVVYAYLLQDRKWESVHISDLHEIAFDENLLDSLVLPPEIKSTVQALAWNASQKVGDTSDANYMTGKGNGQILLLHGAPGVGKTATAECVAELVKRPLISLTCGDLGTHVTAVETTLKKYMSWGEIWNGVVLLDEADVYLESRQKGEVERNALVSVFLRELERYQGIMFLTTNRIGTFDDAFLSRVHVGLLYKSLTDKDREKVWMNNFERLGKEKRDPPVKVHANAELYVSGCWKKEGEIQEDLINIQWNGREIRNAFQTALALASYETNGAKKQGEAKKDVVLRAEHIQSVVGMSKQFKIFVNDTKKGDEESRARLYRLRGSSDGEVTKESSFNYGTPSKRKLNPGE